MLPTTASVMLARIQFGAAASYHFLFVPLTLGLAWILFTMECAYVFTGREVYKDMVKFWGKLFAINFAMGVLTGLTLEFQFGTNWAYYSQYVGDIFGTPLAIEGFVAFMLESTFLGLFFFGWRFLTKGQHLFATFCLAIGSSLSALLILVANGFMQHPAGAYFNFANMRMETSSLWHLFMNPIAQVGFAHTVTAGYVTGAVFVMAISSYYLLKGRDLEFAKRSFAIAVGFGLIASIMVIFMGDQNGLAVYRYQPMKLAAIEAEWTTQKPPANFNMFAWPSQSEQKNIFQAQLPGVLGLLVTHSVHGIVPGIRSIEQENHAKILRGIKAYGLLEKLRSGDDTPAIRNSFMKYQPDLGYGLLLKRYTDSVTNATPVQINQAVKDTVPNVWLLFWTFRVMVLFGFLMFAAFFFGFILLMFGRVWRHRWLMHWALWTLPMPWIAALCGWFVTEHGRQPWTVFGVLPTTISSSSLTSVDLGLSVAAFVTFYTGLFIVEMVLMFKYARLGPSSLRLGKYHFEENNSAEARS